MEADEPAVIAELLAVPGFMPRLLRMLTRCYGNIAFLGRCVEVTWYGRSTNVFSIPVAVYVSRLGSYRLIAVGGDSASVLPTSTIYLSLVSRHGLPTIIHGAVARPPPLPTVGTHDEALEVMRVAGLARVPVPDDGPPLRAARVPGVEIEMAMRYREREEKAELHPIGFINEAAEWQAQRAVEECVWHMKGMNRAPVMTI